MRKAAAIIPWPLEYIPPHTQTHTPNDTHTHTQSAWWDREGRAQQKALMERERGRVLDCRLTRSLFVWRREAGEASAQSLLLTAHGAVTGGERVMEDTRGLSLHCQAMTTTPDLLPRFVVSLGVGVTDRSRPGRVVQSDGFSPTAAAAPAVWRSERWIHS